MTASKKPIATLLLRSIGELLFVIALVFATGWIGVRLATAVHDWPIQAARDGGMELGIVKSNRQGDVTFEEGPGYVGWWHCSGQWALDWRVQPARPGRYRVEALIACADRHAAGQIEIQIGEQTLTAAVPGTGGASRWKSIELGQLAIENRPYTLTLRSAASAPTLNIKNVTLRPI